MQQPLHLPCVKATSLDVAAVQSALMTAKFVTSTLNALMARMKITAVSTDMLHNSVI